MLKSLIDFKIDFVFKQIFGSSKHPKILISFLNATLKPNFPIKQVEIQNPESEKVSSFEMGIEEIREAKDELIRLSGDKEWI